MYQKTFKNIIFQLQGDTILEAIYDDAFLRFENIHIQIEKYNVSSLTTQTTF